MERITVVVVDDHPGWWDAFAYAFERESDIVKIGEARTGEEGLSLILELEPTVVIVDMHLPAMSGLDLIRAVKSCGSKTRCLAFSGHSFFHTREELAKLGVDGILTKDQDFRQYYIPAIRLIASGIQVLNTACMDNPDPSGTDLNLTADDLLLIEIIQSRVKNQVAADRLNITVSGLKFRIKQLCLKLDTTREDIASRQCSRLQQRSSL